MTDSHSAARPVLNTKELAKLGSKLLEDVTAHRGSNAANVTALICRSDELLKAAHSVAASHSSSNFGYHGALYYRDFDVPPIGSMFNVEWGRIHGIPPGWRKREPDEVRVRIEELASDTFDDIENAVKAPLDSARKLHREILIQLAPLHQLSDSGREKQLLDALEHFDWKDSAHNDYASAALNSFPRMTRDSAAFTQGVMFTAHSYYEAAAAQVKRSCEAVQELWNSAERLLRQLELGATQALVTRPESSDGASIATKYERLKTGALLLAALTSSFLIAAAAGLAIRKWQWKWLLDHPNSYSIQWSSCAVLLLFLIGLVVRKFRSFCWGFALIPLIVAVLQSLGGPLHTP